LPKFKNTFALNGKAKLKSTPINYSLMSEEKTLEEIRNELKEIKEGVEGISAPLPLIPATLITCSFLSGNSPILGASLFSAHGAGRPRLHSVPLRARATGYPSKAGVLKPITAKPHKVGVTLLSRVRLVFIIILCLPLSSICLLF